MLLRLELKGIVVIFICTLVLILLNDYISFEFMLMFGTDISAMSRYLRLILCVYITYGIFEYFMGLKKYFNFIIAKILGSIVLVFSFLKFYHHYYLVEPYSASIISLLILLATITIAELTSLVIMKIKVNLIGYTNLALYVYLLIVCSLLLLSYLPREVIFNVFYLLY
ncbi:MAG: hypothetical protein AB6733_13090 [Clostridiaceae bacterium]